VLLTLPSSIGRLSQTREGSANVMRLRMGRPPTPPVFWMCGRERSYEEGILYVWQRKDLQVAKNGVLADFSDVWQGKGLADFGCYSRQMISQRVRLVNG
jgi:hypothetical protein